MTSKLVVNTIEADTGISSVSFASSISLSSTSKFFFSDAGIDIGPDTNINRPATGVLGFNINGSEKVRINSTGKVGIGTNNPAAALHISNSVAEIRLTDSDGDGDYSQIISGATGNLFLSADAGNGGNDSRMSFLVDNTERLRIQSDGNVGIATDLSGGGGAYGRLSVVIPSQSGGSALQVMNSAVGSGDGSLTNIVLRSVNNLGTLWAGAEYRAHEHIFKNQGTEALRIISTGKVGIGVTNPDAKLEVRDGASTGIIVRCTSTQSTDSNKALRVRNNSDTNTFSVSHKGQGYFAGKVGINETNPDSELEINRGSEGKYMTVGGDDASNGRGLSFTSSEGGTGSNGALHTINAKSGNGAIALATAGTERFRVDRNGYVTMPYRPAFKIGIMSQSSPNSGVVSENNGFTLKDGSSGDTLRDAFNTGDHFNQATGRFTAPVTGLYYFHFSVMRSSSSGSGSMDLRIKKNTALMLARSYRANYSTEGNFASMNVTTITNMTAGHYIEFHLGANMSVYEDDSYMLGYLLG